MVTETRDKYTITIDNERTKYSTKYIALAATDDDILAFAKAFNSLQDVEMKYVAKVCTYNLERE